MGLFIFASIIAFYVFLVICTIRNARGNTKDELKLHAMDERLKRIEQILEDTEPKKKGE